MPGKRSPEAIAKFKKTMAAKKAAGWSPKPHKRRRSKHLPTQMTFPLHVVPDKPAKKPAEVRVRREKLIDGIVLSRIEGADKTVLALEVVRLLQIILK
jgi:hypothetical protein